MHRLLKSPEQLAAVLNGVADAITAQDHTGRFIYANEAAARALGYESTEALLQAPPDDAGVPYEILDEAGQPLTADRLPGRLALQGIITTDQTVQFKIKLTGEERWSIIKARPVYDQDGSVAFVVNIFQDITRLKQAEQTLAHQREQLQASETRFRTMADHAPVLIWMSGLDKSCYYFNRPWLEFTGRTLEQEVGYGWAEGVHPDDVDRCVQTYNAAFEARQTFTMEYRLRHKDGDYRWLWNNGVPLFAPDGSFAGYIGSCVDITERRENEQRTLLLQQLTAALAGAVTAEQVADVMAGQVLSALGGHLAAVMQVSDDGLCLEAVNVIGIPPAIVSRYARLPLSSTVPITDAARDRQPIWIETLHDYESRYPHIHQTTQAITNTQAMACVPLMVQDQVIGAFGVSFPYPRRMTAADRAFIVALAQQCAQALERARLHKEAQNLAAMNERQRLARDLHDAVSQTLFSASVIAESLPRLWEQSPARTLHLLEQLRLLNRGAMAEMRSLLVELRPEALLNTRLETLLAQLVDTAKVRKQMDIALKINLGARHPLPPDVHIAFYRIAQEALTNIIKHTDATEVVIELNELPRRADLSISDNGAGFNPRAVVSGIGLASMRERAEGVSARLRVVSHRGNGTRVAVTWQRP